MKPKISVRYFAVLRDLAGRSEETLEVEPQLSASQLYMQLAEKYSFSLNLKDIRVAVNDDFASGDRILTDGDTLVFIPPVSGG